MANDNGKGKEDFLRKLRKWLIEKSKGTTLATQEKQIEELDLDEEAQKKNKKEGRK